MVKILKLTDKNSGRQDLKTVSSTLPFTLSLFPTEDHWLRRSKIGLRPLGGVLLSPKGEGSLSSDVLWPLHVESSMASPSKMSSLPGSSPEGNYYLFPMVVDIIVEAWIEDTYSW